LLERVLSLIAVDDRRVPTRICGLLAQRVVTISSIQMTHDRAASRWTIRLVAYVETELELELLIRRLNRLVDVLEVVEVAAT
jgi:acetolactate synthase small subunit